jgi:hypothetical protein
MSCNHDSRTAIAADRIALEATGNVLDFPRNNLTYYAKASATTTVGTCPTYATLPVGLRFTLDNSQGSGSMTIIPASGTAAVVTSGKIYDFIVGESGALKAGELAAHPQ